MLSKSINVTRFKVAYTTGKGSALANVFDSLKLFSFKPIDDIPEETSCGWTTWEDLTDTDWSTAPPEKGEYMAFAMRIDTRKVPPAILDKELSLAFKEEEKRMLEVGKKFISRERKAELKDKTKLRLMMKTMPTPKQIGVIWNTTEDTVMILSVNDKEVARFEDLFAHSFFAKLEPYQMDVINAPPSEFLPWIWFNSEVRGGKISHELRAEAREKMVLSTATSSVSAVCAVEEAKLALKLGKTMTSLSVMFDNLTDWGTTVFGGNVSQLGSLKLPPYDRTQDDEPDSEFLDRVFCMEKIFSYVDDTYKHFQSVKASVEREMGVWIYGSLDQVPPKQLSLPMAGASSLDSEHEDAPACSTCAHVSGDTECSSCKMDTLGNYAPRQEQAAATQEVQ